MNTASRLAAAAVGALLVSAGMNRRLRRRLAQLLAPDEALGPRDLVAFVPRPGGDGAWALDRNGNVFAYGTAPEFREVPQPVPWRESPFVAMAATPSGQGLWILDRAGNVHAFGDAPEFREVPQPEPWRGEPFVAIAATPSGRGVWTVDRRGNTFAFGDAVELRPPRPGG
jgi:hypothetical protein